MPRILAVLSLLLSSAAIAGDWPQWLGPTRDGCSTEVVLPWKVDPPVVWRQPVGEGNGSPTVAAGKVFVHGKIAEKDEEEVVAFDALTGKAVWRSRLKRGPFKSFYGNGPRATPAYADGKLYTFGITGVLTCLDAENGKEIWHKELLKEFKASNILFGMACSPLVDDGRVLVNIGAKGASIVALDAADGRTIWQALDDRASYSSPILRSTGSQKQVVFLTGAALVGLDPSSGQLAWKFPLVDKLFESSTTPVKIGDMLMASSITYGSVGLSIAGSEPKQAWKMEELTCYFATPVPVGDELYVVTGTKPPSRVNKATLYCIDSKTGKTHWKRENVGKYHATVLRTGDNKLLLLEEAGSLVLLDPSPKEYRELARAKVCGDTWAHPALSDAKLFVRDGKEVICLDLAPKP